MTQSFIDTQNEVFGILTDLKQRAANNQSTSKRYKYVETEKLIHSAMNEIHESLGIKNMTIGYAPKSKHTGHVINIDTEKQVILAEDSPYFLRVILMNSFNGESSLRSRVGLFRQVCSNGLVVGSDLFNDRIIHVNSQNTESALEAIPEKISNVVQYATQQLPEVVSKLNTEITETTAQELLEYANTGQKVKDQIMKTWKSPTREADAGETAWSLYNVTNEVIDGRSRSELSKFYRNDKLMSDFFNYIVAQPTVKSP